MERRRGQIQAKWSPLPVDFLKLVAEVFGKNFDEGLKKLTKLKGAESHFHCSGRIYPEELVLSVSLMHAGQISATTVYASMDFDPKASSPTVQDLLNACVDAAGGLFGTMLDPKNPDAIEQIADESLAALEGVPFDWTPMDVDRYKVFLKIDKSNPSLEEAAEEWLSKNDPGLKQLEEETERETEKLFVTGPAKRPIKKGEFH